MYKRFQTIIIRKEVERRRQLSKIIPDFWPPALGTTCKLLGMWGALTKNAQALASIAAEQAQKGLASANQLLEKLDGQLEGEEGEGEDEDDINSEDGSRKEVIKETKLDEELSTSTSADADIDHHQAIKNSEIISDNVPVVEDSVTIKEINHLVMGIGWHLFNNRFIVK